MGPLSLVATALPIALSESMDVYLIDQTVDPLADVLSPWGIPFTFVTAYSRRHLPEVLQRRSCLNKPFTDREIISLITTLTGMA